MLPFIISGESKEEKHHGKEENEKAAKGERAFMLSLVCWWQNRMLNDDG